MLAELRGQYEPLLNFKELGRNHYELLVGSPTSKKTARGCLPGREALKVEALAHLDLNGELANLKFGDVKRALEDMRWGTQRAWRLPRALEAFAIASALTAEPSLARQVSRFWIQLDEKGDRGIFFIVWDGLANGFTVVDYELINLAPKAGQSQRARSARLIAVPSSQ